MRRFAIALLISSMTATGMTQELPPPPWHLVDIVYRIPKAVEFKSLSIDAEISGQVEPGVGLYIAPFGYGKLNGIGFYGGVQNWRNFSPENGIDPELNRIGIFSRWEERDLRFTRTVSGGWNQSSGHEGDFIGVRAPYPWKTGRYTFTLSSGDPAKASGGIVGRWIEMHIRSHADGTVRAIGALFFPRKDQELDTTIYSFVEIFGARVPKARYPRMKIVFSRFLLNGQPLAPEEVHASFPEDVPQIASVTGDAERVVITLGDEVSRESFRQRLH